ncbi:MAG: Flavodoxin reductases (ferredoxin-NADPH reductases) family 1 [uncultured Thermomicrobiales bacterium]|uniref:Flavodoxin reductases (Ferredoxin-NADPH reductases) family 1 n=1 Tax=uncultured Thermomicrobiales bacterium TaxID=1645740 RepID=A0A6J4VB52_9BACT|nr:MAG: Flavodoxin reductases (ferredoxin-NADPH reductases) family 1 [uncultured Thermomicrobiales bacterium]
MLARGIQVAGNEAIGAAAVTALYHYPIKSCAGAALDVAALDARGIVHDREFMLVDAANGRFLTQRELPRMALITPRLDDGADTVLTVSAPGVSPLSVPVRASGPTREVIVWRDGCRVVDQGDEIARWFAAFLGVACRLVRLADDFERKVDPAYATSARDQVGFADGFPLLLISEESLADLNARLAEPLPMNRFRPNVVVAGAGGPFAEDGWSRVRIGGTILHVVKACARCAITTTDQRTAAVGKEPLTTLATYRRGERGVLFGQNLIHEGPGTIRLGDRVEIPAGR